MEESNFDFLSEGDGIHEQMMTSKCDVGVVGSMVAWFKWLLSGYVVA